MATGRPQTALEHYRKAASHDPDDAILQARIGTALAQMDDLDGAIDAFERAVTLDPDDPGLQQALETLRNQASGK